MPSGSLKISSASGVSAPPSPSLNTPIRLNSAETRQLRRLMKSLLSSNGDFDAFLIDYFPELYHRIARVPERTTRENLLLLAEDPATILQALRDVDPVCADREYLDSAISSGSPGSSETAKSLPSPSGYGAPVPFVGRRTEQLRAVNILQQGQPLWVFGPRRIGKTRFLQELQRLQSPHDDVFFISLRDFSRTTLQDPRELDQALASRIIERIQSITQPKLAQLLSGSQPKPEAGNLTRQVLHYLIETRSRFVVLLLDDIDGLEGSPAADWLLPMLRAAVDRQGASGRPRLRIAFASAQSPVSLQYRPQGSPFNIAVQLSLSDLSEAAIWELAHHYHIGLFREEMPELLRQIGGHPYLLNVLFQTAASRRCDTMRLLRTHTANGADSIFKPYLDYFRNYLERDPKLAEIVKEVLARRRVHRSMALHQLVAEGVVVLAPDGSTRLRYALLEQLGALRHHGP